VGEDIAVKIVPSPTRPSIPGALRWRRARRARFHRKAAGKAKAHGHDVEIDQVISLQILGSSTGNEKIPPR
jgi:hypothetical protein